MTALAYVIYLVPAVIIPLLIARHEDKFPPPIAKTPFWAMAMIGLGWPVYAIAAVWGLIDGWRR